MEYRQLGRSGLKVPGGGTNATEATRLLDICLEHGAVLMDTADIYSFGASEEILGRAIKNRRDKFLDIIN